MYERTLYLDADVWIRGQCPDLFAMHPRGAVYMHDDTPFLDCVTWLRNEMAAVAMSQQSKKPKPLKRWNTGVVIVDRKDAIVWRAPRKPIPVGHVMEQHHVTVAANDHGIPILRIDTRFNLQWWMKYHFKRLAESADIIHYANAPHDERIESLRRHAQADLGYGFATHRVNSTLREPG
ncbi:hypothetical protein [Crateriforma conspicua]|nr:hypothetical protein [Crateriforma conspicua]